MSANLRKHLAGLAIFSFIVGCAIFINRLPAPARLIVASTELRASPPRTDWPAPTQFFDFKVRLVSLDFINHQSYTTLSLRQGALETPPEKLWVTTIFFSPERPAGEVRMSTAEISGPFARGDSFEYVAKSSCEWCDYSDAPKASYFARVYVSNAAPGGASFPLSESDTDIRTAEQVVIQAERQRAR